MPKKNKTDIHKKDGTFFQGDEVGHVDKDKKIRKKDGFFFKGDEIGYVDKDKKIRKKDGFIFKGDEVGQIKKNKAFDKDGILFKGNEFGYVDKDGNVRQKDGILFSGRIIGKVKGRDYEGALAFFVLKFKNLSDKVKSLENEYNASKEKTKYTNRINGLLEYLPKSDSLGTLISLKKYYPS